MFLGLNMQLFSRMYMPLLVESVMVWGYGDNFQAVLVSKASSEMERFLDDCHEQHRDVKERCLSRRFIGHGLFAI